MALISTLCSMFLENSEQRQMLSLQLKVLSSQMDLNLQSNPRKRKELEEPISDDSSSDGEHLPPIQSLFSSSSITDAVNYHKRAFTVSVLKYKFIHFLNLLEILRVTFLLI